MKRTEYLYGVSLDEIPNADEHFKAKIKAGEKLVRELLEVPYSERGEFALTAADFDEFGKKSELFCKYVFEFLDDYYWKHGNHLSITIRNLLYRYKDELDGLSFSDAIDVLVARDDLFTIKLVKDWCDNKTRLLIIKPKRGAKYAPRKDK